MQFDSSSVALIAGVILFVVFAGIAYIVFRMLKKTAKVAFRMAVVAAVFGIVALGAFSIYWFGIGSTSKPAKQKPAATRPK